MKRSGSGWGRRWRPVCLVLSGLFLAGILVAQPPEPRGASARAKTLAEVIGPPEFVMELKSRGNDGVVRIFLDGSGQETAMKVVPRGSGICKSLDAQCASELVFVTVGRTLLANEKVVLTGVSDEQCFSKNIFEITAEQNPVFTGAPQGCGKGDVWMYKIEFMIDGEVVGDPIDPGVLIDDGPGT